MHPSNFLREQMPAKILLPIGEAAYLPYNAPHEPLKAGNGASGLREDGDERFEK